MARLIEDLMRPDGRVALVTGGGEGIGAAISHFLADAGADVMVTDVNGDTAERTVASIRGEGGRATAMQLDVTDPASLETAFNEVERRVGLVTVLINNAGIFPICRFAESSAELFDRTMSVNLRAAFLCSRLAAAQMGMAGGAILNIASIEAERPSFPGLSHYGAAKAGMIGLTRHLAYELGPQGIRVNALLPGTIDTPGARRCGGAMDADQLEAANRFIPVGRSGHSGDVAAAALFMVSPAASYISGQCLAIDGGQSVS